MRKYGPRNPLVFNHIPKCAGSSLHAALKEALNPDVMIYGVDLSLLGAYDLDTLSGQTRSSIVVSPDELDQGATFVTGHIAPGTTMLRYLDADHITVLRNPRLRVISQWVHSRSLSDFDLRHWGAIAPAFRAGRGTLREYLELDLIAPNTDNTITRFLAWPHPLLEQSKFLDERHDDELFAAAIARLGQFAFVGVIENPAFLSQLSAWLGRQLSERRVNERQSIPRNRRFDLAVELSAGTIALLDHRTRIDQQLWIHVAQQTFPQSDPSAVLADSWARSLDRYATAMQTPGDFRPVRRAAEALYMLGNGFGSHKYRASD